MNLDGRTLLYGFIAGALSVLVFHQSMVLILHLLKLTPNFPWNLGGSVKPFGIPVLVNQMFWGGLWGVGFAVLGSRIPIGNAAARGAVFGFLGPFLLGGGLLVPLFKGGPMFWMWPGQRWIVGGLIGTAFGLGIALILNLLRRR